MSLRLRFSVPHDRLFLDALERDLKREKAGREPTSVVQGEPARSFSVLGVSWVDMIHARPYMSNLARRPKKLFLQETATLDPLVQVSYIVMHLRFLMNAPMLAADNLRYLSKKGVVWCKLATSQSHEHRDISSTRPKTHLNAKYTLKEERALT
ncbi:hypothetical protein I314_03632 [Cryptococcus bacillisporus CA1873]|uniref:Uncharacterized protein n=1 Tax=Cryptococcus bacillisporus CA1873 TaxID=1296111 RepID=A0ABR5B9S4_CRYGA|nr:hypothetical protein I314_03632 [Cryptococcus bacillisporus CA1873]|eukprot:KIR60341.1 hypothetical protein I314_03632 [Cryptococcus gattii CA1873]